jgi:hypothetical protein
MIDKKQSSLVRIGLATSIAILLLGCSNRPSTDISRVITGDVGKGKALLGIVSAYDLDNHLLGTGAINNGHYTIESDYKGPVKIVATITKYHDEMLKKDVVANNLQMGAYSTVSGDDRIVNITPITEAALRFAGDTKNPSDIKAANHYIAQLSGLKDTDPTKLTVNYLLKDQGKQEDTVSNREALVLLGISADSNLTQHDNPNTTTTKVNNAIDKYVRALYLEKEDPKNDTLDNIVEQPSVTKTWIVDEETTKQIIPEKNNITIPNVIKELPDTDHDKLPDIVDPDDNNTDIDSDGIPDGADVDVNGDGIADNGTDTDGDGINDVADADDDGTAGTDNNQTDSDGDGINDKYDTVDNSEDSTAAKDNAIAKIKAYADDNSKPAPTVQDYADAGVTGVTTDNLFLVPPFPRWNAYLSKITIQYSNGKNKI